MKKMKRLLTLVLTLVMAVSIFTACGGNKENKEEEKAAITATAVKFSKDGKYTTTVKSDKYDLSKISMKNVEISTNANNEVKVNSVKANSNGGYDITFTDVYADSNPTKHYEISVKNVKESAMAGVEYPEITLTPDIESVTLSDKKIKVSLSVKGSEFEDVIGDSDITLGNAFEKMNAKVISSSAKNLTLELKGKLVKNEAGAYQWGTINVAPSVLKNTAYEASAKINVQLNYADFDVSSLKYSEGKVTADLKVHGVADVSKLTKDYVKVEGATVEAVEKKDDNTATLTLSAKDIKNVNDFVDKVSGKKLTVDGYKTETALSQASFYPVFEYVEDDGKNLKLTLKLYSFCGEFDEAINTKQFSFSDGFKDANVESVKVGKDGIATLIISVPANDQKSEALDINGTVKIAADALVNAWGEKASKEASCTRNYSNESLGREVSLNTDTLLEIQKYTRGKNTVFGSICYWGGIAGQVYGIGKGILEATGVIKSEHVQVMEKLEAMDKKLDNIQTGITDIKHELKNMLSSIEYLAIKEQKRELQNKVDNFEDTLIDFYNTLDSVKATQRRAALDMALDEAGVKPDYIGMTPDQIAVEKAKLRQKYLPDMDSMTDRDAAKYTVKLMDYIDAKSEKKRNTEYYSYYTRVEELESKFKNICGMVNKSTASNPIGFYDELCSYTYNFDSQTYDFRLANRVTLQYRLVEALSALAIHYTAAATPDSDQFDLIGSAFNKTMSNKIWDVSGYPPKQIKANPHHKFRSGLIYDTDPEYYPYCYPLGRKVCIFITGYKYNWTEREHSLIWSLTEARDFVSRMHANSCMDELKSAGISCAYAMNGSAPNKRGDYYGKISYKHQLRGNYRYIYFIHQDKKIDGYDINKEGSGVWPYSDDVIYFIDYKEAQEYFKNSSPVLYYRAHMENKGWLFWRESGETAGLTNEALQIESLQIDLCDMNGKGMLKYRGYVQDKKWQDWVDSSTDKYAGTTGEGKRLEAIEIKVKDKYADKYNIVYRAYVQNKGWGNWVKNGQTAGAIDENRKIQAIEIKAETK
jgi:hypothetical protein